MIHLKFNNELIIIDSHKTSEIAQHSYNCLIIYQSLKEYKRFEIEKRTYA